MQNGARTGELLRPLPDHSPVLVVAAVLQVAMNSVELAFGFEFDLQFCDVEVFGVVKFTREDGVHQLGNSFRDLAGVALLRHFEENDLGGDLGVDESSRVADCGCRSICCLKRSANLLPRTVRFWRA